MSSETEPSKIVRFVPRRRASGPVEPAIAKTIEQLLTLTEMIQRLEELIAEAPGADPLSLAATRCVATMKADALRIATSMEALLPRALLAAAAPELERERQVGTP
jgi:hypothetical protein